MDILAGMLGYLAGIGALFGALALSLVLFTSTENKPPAPRQPQSATAMIVAPGASGKTPAAQARVKPAVEPQKHQRAAATPVEPARAATVAHDAHPRSAMSAAKSRRLAHEERARRWAYQQDAKEPSKEPSFESRFLGYAE
jgi:predicted lipid-binding transport protein (Tim44 family)